MADTVNPAKHGTEKNKHKNRPLDRMIAAECRQFIDCIRGNHQYAKFYWLGSCEILDSSVHKGGIDVLMMRVCIKKDGEFQL